MGEGSWRRELVQGERILSGERELVRRGEDQAGWGDPGADQRPDSSRFSHVLHS